MIDRKRASKILRTVPIPQAFLFFTDIGQYTGVFAVSLTDFSEKLESISLKSIEFHFTRGDFERWIRETLGDKYLANRIKGIDRSIQGEELRKSILRIVERHLNMLKQITRTNKPIKT